MQNLQHLICYHLRHEKGDKIKANCTENANHIAEFNQILAEYIKYIRIFCK